MVQEQTYSTGDAVKEYTNGRGDARVSIMTNPNAVKQLLEIARISETELAIRPELQKLVAKIEKTLNASGAGGPGHTF